MIFCPPAFLTDNSKKRLRAGSFADNCGAADDPCGQRWDLGPISYGQKGYLAREA
jgi:hypothetical protein